MKLKDKPEQRNHSRRTLLLGVGGCALAAGQGVLSLPARPRGLPVSKAPEFEAGSAFHIRYSTSRWVVIRRGHRQLPDPPGPTGTVSTLIARHPNTGLPVKGALGATGTLSGRDEVLPPVLKITRWVLTRYENSLSYSILCLLSRNGVLTRCAPF
jgi:hypothetical protein